MGLAERDPFVFGDAEAEDASFLATGNLGARRQVAQFLSGVNVEDIDGVVLFVLEKSGTAATEDSVAVVSHPKTAGQGYGAQRLSGSRLKEPRPFFLFQHQAIPVRRKHGPGRTPPDPLDGFAVLRNAAEFDRFAGGIGDAAD